MNDKADLTIHVRCIAEQYIAALSDTCIRTHPELVVNSRPSRPSVLASRIRDSDT